MSALGLKKNVKSDPTIQNIPKQTKGEVSQFQEYVCFFPTKIKQHLIIIVLQSMVAMDTKMKATAKINPFFFLYWETA